MNIRRAKQNDFLAIAKLDREAWKDNGNPEFIPDGEHAWRIWVEHVFVYCAESNGGLVGAILAFPGIDGKYCVHKVFVSKKERGKEIGSKLFDILLNKLDSIKAESFLTVDPENRSAVALYEKWGFKDRKFIKGFYRENEDRYVLYRKPEH